MVFTARDHPEGFEAAREKIRAAFLANKHLSNEEEIKDALRMGRWKLHEMESIIRMHRYRRLHRRYGHGVDDREERVVLRVSD